MLEHAHVTTVPSRRTAAIPLRIPRAEMRTVMGPGIEELMRTLSAQGLVPAGPWLTHHLRMEPDVFDFEIAVPVEVEVEPAGRVKPGSLPAGAVARAVYRGPYEGLPAAWGEFDAWVEGNGHTPAEELWECYLEGPESGADPADYRTELNRPLVAVEGGTTGSAPMSGRSAGSRSSTTS